MQDASPPTVSATSVVAALAPAVRVSCTWTAAASGTIVTTLADVTGEAAEVAQAALESQGYACRREEAALTCSRTEGDVTDDIVLREGVWLSSRLSAWHPDLYTARITSRLWEG